MAYIANGTLTVSSRDLSSIFILSWLIEMQIFSFWFHVHDWLSVMNEWFLEALMKWSWSRFVVVKHAWVLLLLREWISAMVKTTSSLRVVSVNLLLVHAWVLVDGMQVLHRSWVKIMSSSRTIHSWIHWGWPVLWWMLLTSIKIRFLGIDGLHCWIT